jgi:hypothetical protein
VLRAGPRMCERGGMEFEQVIGQQFWVRDQELSSARAGCLMGIKA